MKRRFLLSVVLLALMTAASADGQGVTQASAGATQGANQNLEDQVVRGSGEVQTATTRSATSVAASGVSDFSRITFALLVVIGIILILRAVLRQIAAAPGSNHPGTLVSVLSRSMISPRQHVMVLQVGNRLIVVGDSAGRMNPLCEITDPDEMAMLVSRSKQPRGAHSDRQAGSFLNVFRKANEPFNEPDALLAEPEPTEKLIDTDEAVTTQEMHGLMTKVRMLQHQFRAKSAE